MSSAYIFYFVNIIGVNIQMYLNFFSPSLNIVYWLCLYICACICSTGIRKKEEERKSRRKLKLCYSIISSPKLHQIFSYPILRIKLVSSLGPPKLLFPRNNHFFIFHFLYDCCLNLIIVLDSYIMNWFQIQTQEYRYLLSLMNRLKYTNENYGFSKVF